jgi:hypothetical protein
VLRASTLQLLDDIGADRWIFMEPPKNGKSTSRKPNLRRKLSKKTKKNILFEGTFFPDAYYASAGPAPDSALENIEV